MENQKEEQLQRLKKLLARKEARLEAQKRDIQDLKNRIAVKEKALEKAE